MGLVRSVILWLMTFVRVVMMASLCCLVNCSFSSLSTNLKVSKWFKWLHVTREDEKKRLVAREIDIIGNTEKKLIMVPGITKREREFSFIGTWKNPILPQKTQFRVLFLSLFFNPTNIFFVFPKWHKPCLLLNYAMLRRKRTKNKKVSFGVKVAPK